MVNVEYFSQYVNESYKLQSNSNAEEVVKTLCQKLGIKPTCQYLYGLRSVSKDHCDVWLCPSSRLDTHAPSTSFQFRLRFLPSSCDILKDLDAHSYNYLFYQVIYAMKNYGCLESF